MAGVAKAPFDPRKFVHSAQVGGIESYVLDNGSGRGVRALCVHTGGGLRYRVLVDRGLDIDQAFCNQYSLAFLTHQGVTPPSRALDQGIEWLKGFPGGLLTSCGPTNIGPPGEDQGETLGLHGLHSNTAATLESVVGPDLQSGRTEMSIVGVMRYGRLFNPCLELRRTIRSQVGANHIDFTDEFFNAGNEPAPHAWLLHINFGYPLLDEGTELCFDSPKIEPTGVPESRRRFKKGEDYKNMPAPLEGHRGSTEAVAYLFPKSDRNGRTTIGIVNRKIPLGVSIQYSTRQFPRCANWQHLGPGQYVTALEPMNGTVDGRWSDRQRGLLDIIESGDRRKYEYRIEATMSRDRVEELRKLNAKRS